VPAKECRVTVESQSLSAACNTSGAFMIKQVPPGQYDIRISVSGVGETRLSVGAGDDQTTWLGDVMVGVPSAVTGLITADNSADLDTTLIGIPELGLYTQPTVTGGYMLSGVPAGTWKVTIFAPGQSPAARSVTVPPGQPVPKVDFQIKTPAPTQSTK
jgi:hypothetical protein